MYGDIFQVGVTDWAAMVVRTFNPTPSLYTQPPVTSKSHSSASLPKRSTAVALSTRWYQTQTTPSLSFTRAADHGRRCAVWNVPR